MKSGGSQHEHEVKSNPLIESRSECLFCGESESGHCLCDVKPVPSVSDESPGCESVWSDSMLYSKFDNATDIYGSHQRIVKLKYNITTANQICNLICHQKHTHRDIIYNNLLLNRGGSPDLAEGSKR